ncbi:type II toxin-antitoxin system death-on-curing family toxin [Spiroplasma endosymbiont of Colias croceus]
MKRYFIFGIANKTKDKIIHEIAFNRSRNLMSKKGKNTVIIHTNNYSDIKVNIGEIKINFDKEFHENLLKIVTEAIYLVKETHTSYGMEKCDYRERDKGGISSTLYSLTTIWYHNRKNIDILDLAIDLLIRICTGHLIFNGNKRLSVITCSIFLNSMGLYLKWSSETHAYLKYWEDLMTNIADNKYGKDIKEIKENKELNIKNLFLNSIMISNKWIWQ